MDIKRLVEWFKKTFHRHKYDRLLVYPPHNQVCSLDSCKDSDDYGFLLECACGHVKLPKLPYKIKDVLIVRSKQNWRS